LLVRKSTDDAADQNRKDLTAIWEAWLKKVETRPATGGGPGGPGNPFDRPSGAP
ncbi:MAG: hypothetical protein JWO38_7707, partial [Gemmataceae bacterium]|nr:hypothetical protein [Gemmataceae bacterium]